MEVFIERYMMAPVTNVSRPGNLEMVPKNPQVALDGKAIVAQLKNILDVELLSQLPDLKDDLLQITSQIAPVIVSASLAGDYKLRGEAMVQLELIADINKIRGNAAAIAVIKRVAGVALGILSTGIAAGIRGVTGGLV